MKRVFPMFVLTPGEQRVVIFALLLLLAGAWSKPQRDFSHSKVPLATPTATPQISLSPNEQ